MNALVINCSPVRTGATAEIVRLTAEALSERLNVTAVCIDDYQIAFCKGCRLCHQTARCPQQDDLSVFLREWEAAHLIVAVSPSYWADVPGQFKAFIDRCTPYSNTHQPHASLGAGKTGFAIVLRTGPGEQELQRLTETIRHFYGHLDIAWGGAAALCGVAQKEQVALHRQELEDFFRLILQTMPSN